MLDLAFSSAPTNPPEPTRHLCTDLGCVLPLFLVPANTAEPLSYSQARPGNVQAMDLQS